MTDAETIRLQAIRADERQRIAALLTKHADDLEAYAAPGQVVRLVVLLLQLPPS